LVRGTPKSIFCQVRQGFEHLGHLWLMKNSSLPACILLCRPSLMAQRTLAPGFADTGIEKASAKSALAGKYKISVNLLNPWFKIGKISTIFQPKARVPSIKN